MQATFFYRARTPEGIPVRGTIAAEHAEQVIAHLRTRALFVTDVMAQDSMGARIESLRAFRGISHNSLVAFFRSISTMLAAGISLQQALNVQIRQTGDARFSEALHCVLCEIESGHSLSSALRMRPREFPSLYVAMVEAGETGGVLDVVLDRLATMLERSHALRRRVAASLAYPAVVLVSAIVLIFFLIATIVPTFGRMFAQLDVPMPLSTQFLVFIGNELSGPRLWFVVSALGCIAVLAVVFTKKSRTFVSLVDRVRLQTPIVGSIRRRELSARITRMLGTLLRCGVDVVRAVDIVTPLAGSESYRKALAAVSVALREGESITGPLERSGVFDDFLLQMVRVGEEAGALDTLLIKIAEYYESEVEAAIMAFAATIEPVMIAGVGVIVAGIVFSVFIPMYSLVGQIH